MRTETDLRSPVRPLEIFGLRPLAPALRGTADAMLGRSGLPPVLWGLSSLRILRPWISLPTWLGVRRADRRVPLYNLFNRDRRPPAEGYSVRVTRGHDYRGRRFTYDSHHGTDFSVPVGTPVVAAAPGRVFKVANHIDHGGLKVCLDHGGALSTISNHLSRALVAEGQDVARGQVIGLSGASGMEFFLLFPWVSPHLHFDTLLDAEPVDPFARLDRGETPLWRTGNDPIPCSGPEDREFEPTAFDPAAVEAGIAACRHEASRHALEAISDLYRRATELMVLRVFRAPWFDAFPALAAGPVARTPRLDLPFRAEDVTGVVG
jgi:murein DD-endopeptidase